MPRHLRPRFQRGALLCDDLAGERIDFGSHEVPFRDSIGSAVNNISGLTVIASEAKQSRLALPPNGLLRRFAPRNDDKYELNSVGCFFE